MPDFVERGGVGLRHAAPSMGEPSHGLHLNRGDLFQPLKVGLVGSAQTTDSIPGNPIAARSNGVRRDG